MTNKEWGNIGNNYLKGLFALAFQGFFMMVCVGIYAVLVHSMTISSDLHAAMFSIAAYTIVLAYSLFKTAKPYQSQSLMPIKMGEGKYRKTVSGKKYGLCTSTKRPYKGQNQISVKFNKASADFLFTCSSGGSSILLF